jgi:Protein of unknown function (DUF3662)/FHA domain
MPAFLGQIERLLERAFEAPSQRLFRTRLQPVELARALGRAMVAHGQVGPDGLQVPNRYVLELHPGDFGRLAGDRERLERDLATYLLQQTQRRGWQCSGWPEVTLQPADDVPSGRLRVNATTVPRPLAESAPSASAEALGGTSVLPRPERRAQPGTALARAWVELHDGSRIELGSGPLRIGRARANDLVLDHESVSRHHAELRRDRGGVVIADLGSTNGTRVDGQAVREQVLTPGAMIHIGAVPLRFRVAG